MFRGDKIANIEFKPIGYKILLEMLVMGKFQDVIEVPFIFEDPKWTGEMSRPHRAPWPDGQAGCREADAQEGTDKGTAPKNSEWNGRLLHGRVPAA